MSDYTPATGHVRARYVRDDANFLTDWAEFDRWLAEVKAQAWQEGTHAMALELQHHFGDNHKCVTNPYREGENSE